VYAGGHCLYSTARDYSAIQRLLLNGGADGDVRLLRADTVDDMFRNHLGEVTVGTILSADPPASEHVPLGDRKWGLGILLDVDDVPGGRSAGSGGWMGGFNTFYWVDRARSFSAALYTQTIPFFDDRVMELYAAFERAAYAEFADA
jgi:CubicO group peptidase (beta-lactamase class C family)